MSSVRTRHPARLSELGDVQLELELGLIGQMHVELALDALERVVDRLHVAAQLFADLLVALAST